MKTKRERIISAIISVIAIICAVFAYFNNQKAQNADDIPAYADAAYVPVNNNVPSFLESDITTSAYEYYSDLDVLGRCGYAMSCVGIELMPTEERESISQVKPSGWIQGEYEFVDGGMLYNRCHLIGFQLTGENANEKNLITGTRYLNVQGMLPFENMVADYILETGNHVLYRVTPVYVGTELVARGVTMEALSVEDNGEGISFHVYVFNVQPGVVINYSDGSNQLDKVSQQNNTGSSDESKYILNTKNKKFHSSECGQADAISADNRDVFEGDRADLIFRGYEPAGCCNP